MRRAGAGDLFTSSHSHDFKAVHFFFKAPKSTEELVENADS